jgi:hypothetical protein
MMSSSSTAAAAAAAAGSAVAGADMPGFTGCAFRSLLLVIPDTDALAG